MHRTVALLALTLVAAAVAAPPWLRATAPRRAEAGSWHHAFEPDQVPFAGRTDGLVWDDARQHLLLMKRPGTGDGTTSWSWDGHEWNLVSLDGLAKRSDFGIAYDARRRRVVVFGGEAPGGFPGGPRRLAETWEWNGLKWTEIDVAGPSARIFAAMAFDEAHGVALLHGGDVGSRETWTFDGTGWLLVDAEGPEIEQPAMAYDRAGNRVVMFGGDAETWAWNGSKWSRISSAGPEARTAHAMAFDAGGGTVLLSGGYDAEGRVLGDVWELDGNEWRPAGKLPARAEHGMAYDESRGQVIVFGGVGPSVDPERRDTLARSGIRWPAVVRPRDRQPLVAMEQVLAYDQARREVVLFDGRSRETWTWDGAGWTRRTGGKRPSFRHEPGIAYDEERERVVLFGGEGNVTHGDTWEWNGKRWSRRARKGPTPAYSVAMAYDPRQRGVVMFGGGASAPHPLELTDFWVWGGSRWKQVISATIPEERAEAAMVFDAGRRELLMTGGYSVTLDETPGMQTWNFDGEDWRLLITGDPGNRAAHALVYDPVADVTLLFGGFETQTSNYDGLGDLWSWDGAAWTELVPPPGAACPCRRAAHDGLRRGPRRVRDGGPRRTQRDLDLPPLRPGRASRPLIPAAMPPSANRWGCDAAANAHSYNIVVVAVQSFAVVSPIRVRSEDRAVRAFPRSQHVSMSSRAEDHLPLSQRLYVVLVALTDGPRHGYAIKKEIRRITDGAADPGAGSLYRSIQQLSEKGLIEESPERPDPALDDERRVYFRLTDVGREVLTLETGRLQRFVAATVRLVGRTKS